MLNQIRQGQASIARLDMAGIPLRDGKALTRHPSAGLRSSVASHDANLLPGLAHYVIRPVLTEARLMTAKRACDSAYVATLAEELRTIEGKIAAMEKFLHFDSEEAPKLPSQRPPCPAPEGRWDADWIRTKAEELDLRLRRIERWNDK